MLGCPYSLAEHDAVAVEDWVAESIGMHIAPDIWHLQDNRISGLTGKRISVYLSTVPTFLKNTKYKCFHFFQHFPLFIMNK